jgi:uncharacterized membrane protein SpoIIM required for sporulation
MADDALRSLRFRRERESSWRRLEELLARVERRSAGSLTDEEMLEAPALYRAALSSLSVARATSLDSALLDYLEALSARAYFFVYGARSTLMERVGGFFARDWPHAVREIWAATMVSFLIMAAGTAVAFLMVSADPDWFYAFVPEGLTQGRDPGATTEYLRDGLYHDPDDKESALGVFATFLFTHNAGVALLAFALGFAFGMPSCLLLAQTGCMLGAFFGLYVSRGLGLELSGWIFIHGVTELFAVILAGAAGLRIGWSIAFPGARTRLAAAEQAGRQGGVVMIGVVLMLMLAGLLEGFGRQLITSDIARWSIAGMSALIWGGYFYAPRRGAALG